MKQRTPSAPRKNNRTDRIVGGALLGLLVTLAAAGVLLAEITATKTDPQNEAVVSHPVRSLRVWLSAEPDIAKSQMELSGPAGELQVDGLHTMGESDLMARVVGPMPNGDYKAKWTAADKEGTVYEGEWSFRIER